MYHDASRQMRQAGICCSVSLNSHQCLKILTWCGIDIYRVEFREIRTTATVLLSLKSTWYKWYKYYYKSIVPKNDMGMTFMVDFRENRTFASISCCLKLWICSDSTSSGGFPSRDVQDATWESQPLRWSWEQGTWCTTSTVSPATHATKCWPLETILAWRTTWSTAGSTLRLWSKESTRFISITRMWHQGRVRDWGLGLPL